MPNIPSFPGPVQELTTANPTPIAGVYNSVAPTIVSGQQCVAQFDSSGNLFVNIAAGSSGNAAAGLTGSAVPSSGDYIAFSVGGVLTGVSASNPLPITGSISASNPSVGATGSAFPTSATMIGFAGATNLTAVSSSSPLPAIVTNAGTFATQDSNLSGTISGGKVAVSLASTVVAGANAAGSATIGNPVVSGGSDYGGTPHTQTLKVDSSGQIYIGNSSIAVTGTTFNGVVTNSGTFAVQATLSAETTKVIGTVNVAASQTIAVTNTGTFAVQAATTPVAATVQGVSGLTGSATSKTNVVFTAIADNTNTVSLGVMGTAVATSVYAVPVMAGLQASVSGTQTALTGTGTSLNTNITNTAVPVSATSAANTASNPIFTSGSGTLTASAASWTTSTTANTAVNLINNTLQYGSLIVAVTSTSTLTGGTYAIQGSLDNSNWFVVGGWVNQSQFWKTSLSSLAFAASTTQVYTIPVAGIPYIRIILLTSITGATTTVTVVCSASAEAPDVINPQTELTDYNSGNNSNIVASAVPTLAEGALVVALSPNSITTGLINGVAPTYAEWGTNAPSTASAAAVSAKSLSVTTSQNVKASAGNIYALYALNGAASTAWVQFVNSAGAGTLGTASLFSVPIPASTTQPVWIPLPFPVNASTGIAVGASTTNNGATAVGTAVALTVFYL